MRRVIVPVSAEILQKFTRTGATIPCTHVLEGVPDGSRLVDSSVLIDVDTDKRTLFLVFESPGCYLDTDSMMPLTLTSAHRTDQ